MRIRTRTPYAFLLVLLPLLALTSCAGWQERMEKYNQRNHEIAMANAGNTQTPNTQPPNSSNNQQQSISHSGTWTFYPDDGSPTQQYAATFSKRLSDGYLTFTDSTGDSLSGYYPTLTGVWSGWVFTLHIQASDDYSAQGSLRADGQGQSITGGWDFR